MPKKVLTAGDFSLGINKAADARDIRNGELKTARNIDIFSPGLVKNISTIREESETGGFYTSLMYDTAFTGGIKGASNAGYGLFSMEADYPFLKGNGYWMGASTDDPIHFTSMYSSRQAIWQPRGGVHITPKSEIEPRGFSEYSGFACTWFANQFFGMGKIYDIDTTEDNLPVLNTINPHRAEVGDYVYLHDTGNGDADENFNGLWEITSITNSKTLVFHFEYSAVHGGGQAMQTNVSGGYFVIAPRVAMSGFPRLHLKYESISGTIVADSDVVTGVTSNTTLRAGQSISGAGIPDGTIIIGDHVSGGDFGVDITKFYMSQNATASDDITIHVREVAYLSSRGLGNSLIRKPYNSETFSDDKQNVSTNSINHIDNIGTQSTYALTTNNKDLGGSNESFMSMRVLPNTWYKIRLKLRHIRYSENLKISVVNCCADDTDFTNGLTRFLIGYPTDVEDGSGLTSFSNWNTTHYTSNHAKNLYGILNNTVHNTTANDDSTAEVVIYDGTKDGDIDTGDNETYLSARLFTRKPMQTTSNIIANHGGPDGNVDDLDLILKFENYHDGTDDTAGDVIVEIDSIHLYPDSYQNKTNLPNEDRDISDLIPADYFGESYLFLDDSLTNTAISVYAKNTKITTDNHWSDTIIDYGSESGQLNYFTANGALRISDSNFKNDNNKNKWVGHIHRTMYKKAIGWPRGGPGCLSWEDYGWYVTDTHVAKPKSNWIHWGATQRDGNSLNTFHTDESTDIDDLNVVKWDEDFIGSKIPWNSMKGKGENGSSYRFVDTHTGDDPINFDTRWRYYWPVYYDENYATLTKDAVGGRIGAILRQQKKANANGSGRIDGIGKISETSGTGSVVTVTCPAAHGLSSGKKYLVRITGTASQALDGTFVATYLAATTFNIASTVTADLEGQFEIIPMDPSFTSIYGAINKITGDQFEPYGPASSLNPSIGAVKILIDDIPNSTHAAHTEFGGEKQDWEIPEDLAGSTWHAGVSYTYDGLPGLDNQLDGSQDTDVTVMEHLECTHSTGKAPSHEESDASGDVGFTNSHYGTDIWDDLGPKTNYYWGAGAGHPVKLHWSHEKSVAVPGIRVHWCHGSEITPWNPRITGMRVWLRRVIEDTSENTDGTWKLLMDISFDDGEYNYFGGGEMQTHAILGWTPLTIRKDDALAGELTTNYWQSISNDLENWSNTTTYGANDIVSSHGISDGEGQLAVAGYQQIQGERWSTETHAIRTVPALSYKDVNMYHPEDLVNIKYKTAVNLVGKTYAGNVAILDDNADVVSVHGDRVMRSVIGRPDTFTHTDYIRLGEANDGDNVVRLLTFQSLLVGFKTKSILVFDCSSEPEKLLRTIYGNGIDNPASATLVRDGVAWVNKDGVFYYDGQNVTNLFELKIKVEENEFRVQRIDKKYWKSIAGKQGDNRIPMISYDKSSDKLIVISDINDFNDNETGLTGTGLIYDFITKGWVELKNKFPSGKSNLTNFTNSWDGRPIFASTGVNQDGLIEDAEFRIWSYNDGLYSKDNNHFDMVTKDFDFGNPVRKKTIKKIYITFKTLGLHQNIGSDFEELSHDVYRHSNCHVYYAVDGKENFVEFDTSSDNYETGSNQKGLKLENPYTFALSANLEIPQTSLPTVTAAQFAHLSIGDKLVIQSESLVITSLDEDTLDVGVKRQMYDDDADTLVQHSSGTTVSAYSTGWTVAELKPSSTLSTSNIYSLQLRFKGEELDSGDISKSIPNGFEINDISIIYRDKTIT